MMPSADSPVASCKPRLLAEARALPAAVLDDRCLTNKKGNEASRRLLAQPSLQYVSFRGFHLICVALHYGTGIVYHRGPE